MLDGWIGHARRIMWPFRLEGLGADTSLDQMIAGPPTDDPAVRELRSAVSFTGKLARALLGYGLPIYRLEEALHRVTGALGFEATFYLTPTGMIATFELGELQHTQVLLAVPGSVDMEKLAALHALVGRVERGEISAADGSRRIDAILARPPRYGAAVSVVAALLLSASMVPLLGGNVAELWTSAALGLGVGLASHASQRSKVLGRLLPTFAALAATLAAFAVTAAGIPVRPPIVLIASVIALVPGLTLTIAMLELATANLVSGTARLMGALVTFLQMGFGAALGHALVRLGKPAHLAIEHGLPSWSPVAATLAATAAFVVLLQVRVRDALWVLLACAAAVSASLVGGGAFGPVVGAFVGAAVVGILSHMFARRTDRPSLVLLVPGILMLVPGVIGFLSLNSLLQDDPAAALRTGFNMFLVAMALTTGVLVATLAVPLRRSL